MSWDEYIAWLDFGIDKGWISAPVCVTHEGMPPTEAEMKMEEEEEDALWDWCVPGVRLFGHEFVFEQEFPEKPGKHPDGHPVL